MYIMYIRISAEICEFAIRCFIYCSVRDKVCYLKSLKVSGASLILTRDSLVMSIQGFYPLAHQVDLSIIYYQFIFLYHCEKIIFRSSITLSLYHNAKIYTAVNYKRITLKLRFSILIQCNTIKILQYCTHYNTQLKN